MTLSFTEMPRPDSPVARIDPRWKLAAVTGLVVASALVRSLPAAAGFLAVALVLVVVGRLPWRWYLGRVGLTLLFLSPFLVTLPFLLEDAWHGTVVALVLAAKALTVVSLALVVLTSAPWNVTLKAAHALGVPGLLVQLIALTYRYTFLLADELARLRVALRVRGYRNRPSWHSYRTVGHVAGTLLVRGHDRGERVGQAMRCRGFDGRFRALADFRTRLADVAFFLVLAATAVAAVWWDRSG